MHPTVILVGFILCAFFVARGDFPEITLAMLIVSLLSLIARINPLKGTIRMLRRLRWFLLSILILGLWFTPGEALIESLGDWSPTREGLLWGAERVAALSILVLAVVLLLAGLPRDKLIRGFYYLLKPLCIFGITPKQVAVRLTLTLEMCSDSLNSPSAKLKEQFKNNTQGTDAENSKNRTPRLPLMAWREKLVDVLVNQFHKTEQYAANGPESVQIDLGTAPRLHEWWFPLGLFMVFLVVGLI